jgi:hypothetical protein
MQLWKVNDNDGVRKNQRCSSRVHGRLDWIFEIAAGIIQVGVVGVVPDVSCQWSGE